MRGLNIFEVVLLVNIALGILIRLPYEKINRSSRTIDNSHDLREKFFLILTFTGGGTLPFLFFVTSWFDFANFQVHTLTGTLGVLLVIPSNWLFWRSHKDLDRQFSPKLEIKDSHRLITEGVYKNIRHPMYAALFLNSLCQLLLIGNWVVAPAYLIALSCLYFNRVENEENLMLKHFGAEYSDYLNRTNRLFPKSMH